MTLREEALERVLRGLLARLDDAWGDSVGPALYRTDEFDDGGDPTDAARDEVQQLLADARELLDALPAGAEDPPTEIIGPPADDELLGVDRNTCQQIRRPTAEQLLGGGA